MSGALGRPRVHHAATGSTMDRARELAAEGATHGTIVTAGEQTEGRGRQGRPWSAPPGQALLLSVLLREVPDLLPLRAAVAVARVAGDGARIKWPNDVLLADGGKVAGILAESRPQEGWAVLGIGLNAAVDLADLPAELAGRAGTLGRAPDELDAVLDELMAALEAAFALPAAQLLAAWRERDALDGQPITWDGGSGTARGVDGDGRLLVEPDGGGSEVALDAGEVHLGFTPTG